MGKLICDSMTSSPWRDPISAPSLDSIEAVDLADQTSTTTTWENVSGLEEQQKSHLRRLHAKGVLWKHPGDESSSVVFRLSHGGDVEADGNCLFTASQKAMGSTAAKIDPRELRRRTARRFLEDLGSVVSVEETSAIDDAIKHMYSPDLKSGWGIHVVQEVKLLAKKEDREGLDSAIDELVNLGMQREFAAESIYKERCIAVDDGLSWAKYMSISGSPDDEYDIITLQYTEEGLLTVDENREGHAAAFGDDIAIECLASEFKREIYVVQAHGSDAMVDEENCVFFLPHRPRSQICEPPFFLFMKGTGVMTVDTDMNNSKVTVKGVFEPNKLVEYINKRAGKHAVIVKQTLSEKKKDDENKGGKIEKKEKDGEKIDLKDYYQIYPPGLVYAPQLFSDENPNACSVM